MFKGPLDLGGWNPHKEVMRFWCPFPTTNPNGFIYHSNTRVIKTMGLHKAWIPYMEAFAFIGPQYKQDTNGGIFGPKSKASPSFH